MKMTRQEFIETVQKPAIRKWEEGLAAIDKREWWRNGGSVKCSFCYKFMTGIFCSRKDCTICPLNDGKCANEYQFISNSCEKFENDNIERSFFIRIFNRNAKKLLQRIKDVKYEDINWSEK